MKVLFERPNALRVLLFGGLALHKIVWEVMRVRHNSVTQNRAPGLRQSGIKQLAKKTKAAVLLGLLAQTLFVKALPISTRPKRLQAVGVFLFLAGLATAIAGRVGLGASWSNIEDGTANEGHSLITKGIYRYIRHPIYAGDSLLLIGLQLALNSWLAIAMLIPLVVFVRRAVAEEGRLAEVVSGYDSYSKRTKRFVPFVV